MTSLAHRLARPEILALPAVNVVTGDSSDYADDAIRLHLNESAFAPLVQGQEARSVNRYAEPRAPQLRQSMARVYGIDPANLLVTRGADDAIDVLIRSFCRGAGKDAIAICGPTFGAYALFAKIQGAAIVEAQLGPDFEFDAKDLVATVRSQLNVKLVFLCSPNNPTGNVIDPNEVIAVADQLPDTIVVLDEAYIEFSDLASLAPEAAVRENLVILRTLSKAYGLAGARVGCAIANNELIAIISKALPPFPLSSPSIQIATSTLSPSRQLLHQGRIDQVKAERTRMALALSTSSLVAKVWPSQTNFLLIQVTDPEAIREATAKAGIRVRWRPDIGSDVLRLSIGDRDDNQVALAAFGIVEPTAPVRRADVVRETAETKIAISVDLDRATPRRIQTGMAFFDHMLDQVAVHGGFSLILSCDGDLEVDAHHSIEDCALALGSALSQALGPRRGIGRYGFTLPMDEAAAQVLIDLSGRPFSHFNGSFAAGHLGTYPTQMTAHVFRSIAQSLGAAIHVQVQGDDEHHKTEACFKALGRALRQAIRPDGVGNELPSTKGVL